MESTLAPLFQKLRRYPVRKNEPLRAWDTADELLLEEALKRDLTGARILVMNDHFGAITTVMSNVASKIAKLVSYNDSFVSTRATELNLSAAGTPSKVRFANNLDDLEGDFDLVLMRFPKNLSFFEDELQHLEGRIRSRQDSSPEWIAGAMVKHLPKTVFPLIQKYLGETHTSLAQKKARLVFAKGSAKVSAEAKLGHRFQFPIEVKLEGFSKPFLHHSNLFSREKLDIGTRFFLEHIPSGNFKTILDLGCANGIIGLKAKEKNPSARLSFVDESAMAVMSARANFATHFRESVDEADFIWNNCLDQQNEKTVSTRFDLVLCNPPFHQNETVGDFIALQMFADARNALNENGKLRVIGNSHLGYAANLKRLFGNCMTLAKNSKFMIFESVKLP